MDPTIQPAFTKLYNHAGTNKDTIAHLPPDLAERARYSQDQLDRMVTLDPEWLSDRRAEWTERWNRIVAGG
jgi:hypothetical protein